jgi:hypothetical protein
MKLPKEKNKFRNKNGELSAYSFYCGYLQVAEHNNVKLELSHDSCCWKVFGFDHNNKWRLFWECFDTLTDARKFFHNQRRELFGNKKFSY